MIEFVFCDPYILVDTQPVDKNTSPTEFKLTLKIKVFFITSAQDSPSPP